ncbi:Legume-specific protein [Melia azedarach]|uniref:Legume-specific protein n=1 Tax=Melia azedarach TaxID=155640 RepID=A0ACC1X333_MELAZ|nr:Legume-specific protein [Melia azedarach]
MEGLIPFVYRAIMQYKNGNQVALGSWYSDSPSASYMRLPGDSGRFQTSDIQLFQPDYGFSNSTSTTSSSSMAPPSATTQIILSTGVQSPVCRLTSRRVAI